MPFMAKLKLAFIIAIAVFMGVDLAAVAQDKTQPHIIMIYGGYSSYVRKENGEIKGTIPPYIDKIAKGAGVKVTWLYSLNWVNTLRQNRPNFCYCTLLWTQERKKFIRFSQPIGRISSYVVMTHARNKGLRNYTSLKQAVSESKLKLTLRSRASYGAMVNAFKDYENVAQLDATTPRMLALIKNGMVDYSIIPKKSAAYNVGRTTSGDKLIIIDHYTDLLDYRPSYHIGCSKSTSPDIIAKLNAAISQHDPVE